MTSKKLTVGHGLFETMPLSLPIDKVPSDILLDAPTPAELIKTVRLVTDAYLGINSAMLIGQQRDSPVRTSTNIALKQYYKDRPGNMPTRHNMQSMFFLREHNLNEMHAKNIRAIRNDVYSRDGFLKGILQYNLSYLDIKVLTGFVQNDILALMYSDAHNIFCSKKMFKFRVPQEIKDKVITFYNYQLKWFDLYNHSDNYPVDYIQKLSDVGLNTTEAYVVIMNYTKTVRLDLRYGNARSATFPPVLYTVDKNEPFKHIEINHPYKVKGVVFDKVGVMRPRAAFITYDMVKNFYDAGLCYMTIVRLAIVGIDYIRRYIYRTAPDFASALALDDLMYKRHINQARNLLHNPKLYTTIEWTI